MLIHGILLIFGTLVVRTGQVDAAFVRVVVGQEGESS